MQHFVVMGVTGCGKSSVAELITPLINATFIEADSLHGSANIAKMASGEALNDDDRWPWLLRVANAMQVPTAPVVVSCSCLRRAYRDYLCAHAQVPIGFIHLYNNDGVIAKRMAKRTDHFMPTSLLDSQLQLLEHLETDEDGVLVDIDQTLSSVVTEAMMFVNSVRS